MYVEGLKALLKPGKGIQFPSNLIHEILTDSHRKILHWFEEIQFVL